LHNLGAASHHGQPANTAELMHGGVATKACSVAHFDVAADHHSVGKNHIVAYLAIVGHMGANHQQAIVANNCGFAVMHRAMHSNVFSNRISLTDH
jgi:hypothetical protein